MFSLEKRGVCRVSGVVSIESLKFEEITNISLDLNEILQTLSLKKQRFQQSLHALFLN